MCGRYLIKSSLPAIAEALGVDAARVERAGHDRPRYNVAPTQQAPICRAGANGRRELIAMRWGLVPHWARERTIGSRWINARAETVATKPAFRDALRRRRCLVPADGYYEWQRVAARRQPWLLRLRDRTPLCFAGLWESHRDADGDLLLSYTIITTDANALSAPIHARMPAILASGDYAAWLATTTTDPAALTALLGPYPDHALRAQPVSTWVNDPRHDDPRCAQSVSWTALATDPYWA